LLGGARGQVSVRPHASASPRLSARSLWSLVSTLGLTPFACRHARFAGLSAFFVCRPRPVAYHEPPCAAAGVDVRSVGPRRLPESEPAGRGVLTSEAKPKRADKARSAVLTSWRSQRARVSRWSGGLVDDGFLRRWGLALRVWAWRGVIFASVFRRGGFLVVGPWGLQGCGRRRASRRSLRAGPGIFARGPTSSRPPLG
jgi:hypothetical protein